MQHADEDIWKNINHVIDTRCIHCLLKLEIANYEQSGLGRRGSIKRWCDTCQT